MTTEFQAEHLLATLDIDGVLCDVHVRIAYDGLEYIGRLWFSGPAVGEGYVRDHGTIPGRTLEEAIQLAKRFTNDDLLRRWYRARAEKRKYLQLRRSTDTLLEKVKFMNRVALSAKAGLMSAADAQQELSLVVRQLHELVDHLPNVAGVEEQE